jgi:hypothetical protein
VEHDLLGKPDAFGLYPIRNGFFLT